MRAVAHAVTSANLVWLGPALALFFAGVGVRSLRWRILLTPLKPLAASTLFRVVVIGFMANNLLPARIGELVRAYVLWRDERVPPGGTLGTIVLERVLDGLALLLLFAVGSLIVPEQGSLTVVAVLGAILFLGAAMVLLALVLAPSLALRMAAWAVQPLPLHLAERLLRLLEHFIAGLGVLRSPRALVSALLLSCLAWGLEASMYYMIAQGFALRLPFAAAMLGTAAANFAAMIPSAPAYVGTFHYALKTVITGFGTSEDVAVAYTLLVHATLVVPIVLLGLWFLWREDLSLADIRQSRLRREAHLVGGPSQR